MPARKLQYDVSVNTSEAVRDLTRLGDAGSDAGRTIADGFDQAESASKKALDALSAQLDQVQADAKGTADAVAAIKAELTVEIDDSKVAGFVTDLKSKMGVAFDDVTADAKQFAAVLERGVDLSRTTSEIRGVGDELDTVRDHGDQSRSVLANLAGNTAQDLGELGGVVGSLGVGVGQLAEYAVDGNIALSNLAGVAGPMAALALAGAGVQDVMANIAATKAFNADQIKAFSDAVAELGNSSLALRDSLDGAFNVRVDDNSIWGQLTNKQKTTDLADDLAAVGVSLTDIDDIIRSGASSREAFELLPDVQNLDTLLQNAGLSVEQYQAIMDGVFETTKNWTTATNGANDAAQFFGSSLENINDAIESQLIAEDPFTRFRQGLFVTANGVVDLQAIWNDVVRDMQDDDANFSTTGENVDILARAMERSTDEVIALARETAHAGKSMQDMQEKTSAAAGSADDAATAFGKTAGAAHDIRQVMAGAEWGATSIEAAATAMGEFFSSAEAGKDAVAGVQEALDNLAEAHAAGGTLLPDLSTPEGRATWNALEQLGSSLIPEIQQAFDDSRGSVDTFSQKMDGLYYRTLAQLSDQLNITTEDAALLLQQIGLVPENFSTQYELIGQADAQAKLALLQGQIEALPADVQTQVTMLIATGDYMGAVQVIKNYAASNSATVPLHSNTAPANQEIAGFRNAQSSTPIAIRVDPWWSSLWSSPPVGHSRAATSTAPATMAAPATTATAGDPVPAMMFAPAGRQVNLDVHVSAAVIGNRYEVERAVRGAVNDLVRLGRL